MPATFRRLRLSARSNKLNAQIAELQADIKGSEQAVKANQAAAERYVDRSLKRFMTDDDNKKLYQRIPRHGRRWTPR